MSGQNYFGTKDAARQLGVTPDRLQRAVWSGRVDEPLRGPGNVFLWTVKDLERASWRLLGRPFTERPDK